MATPKSPLRLLPKLRLVPPGEADRNADFLNRATNGFTLSEHQRLTSMGRAGWIREQLAPTGGDTLVATRILSTLGVTRLSGITYFERYRTDIGGAAREIQEATITRAIHSRWQLRERLVDFWHDHFSVALQTSGTTRLSHAEYDRSVIRAHVFGRFEDMLIASAKSPSMLEYLDGKSNVAEGPNENYAREVLELHTLGVDGPYTETDIVELARCLTGWTFYGIFDADQPGQFRFRDNRHDTGAKTVLGVQIPAGGGVSDGETVLSFLAAHPSTVDFVSRKLVRRFVSETAPESAVDMVKSAWFRSGGDLRLVTQAVFSDAVADAAAPWDNRKVKRPFQFAAGLLRASGSLSDDAYRAIRNRLPDLGQGIFQWPAPNGYPDSSAAWGGDLYGRWDFASDFARGNLGGIVFPDATLDALRNGVPISELATRLDEVLTGGRSAASSIAEVQDWIDSRSNFSSRDFREALGMVASTPDFLQT